MKVEDLSAAPSTGRSFPVATRLWGAFAYGGCSFGIVFANKYVLTTLGYVPLQPIKPVSSFGVQIFPLPLFFFVGLVSGLGGTQRLSLPMFTALRHTTIFLTMVLECFVLGKHPSNNVKASVVLIVWGSLVAAYYDLGFDAYGYTLIFVNNFASALNGIYVKKKLDANELGTYGLLFYNAFFMIPLAVVLLLFTSDLEKVLYFFETSTEVYHVVFVMICTFFFGLLLNYTMYRCTEVNSALTTTIVGAAKNTAITYIGMFAAGDYVFQWFNFLGISMTVVGSVLYAYLVFVLETGQVGDYRLVSVEAKG
ncbi:TPT domain-containing protein [Aphelenchoides fujianensis]|nr:TPT domain-containing protein [Aphelenchoides fujianensis]